jgi:ABC-type sugar transport system substrate-binding protein
MTAITFKTAETTGWQKNDPVADIDTKAVDMKNSSLIARSPLRPLLIGAAALTLGAAAACSSGDASGGTSTTGSSADVSAATADLAKYTGEVTSLPPVAPVSGLSALQGKTVWYIPIGSAAPILNAFGVGMTGALDKLGMHIHVCDGKFLPTTIASCMDQAATQGADAVVTGYVDYKLVPTAFDNLVAKHIPVLVAGEANDSGKDASPAFAFDDTTPTIELLQKLAAESVIADSKGAAKILYVGVTDSPQTLAGAAYAKKYVKDNCPACTFTEVDYNTASLNKLPSQVSAALISHPDTTHVVVELDAGAANAVSGIQTAGFANKVKLVSTNGGLDSLQRIKAGQVQVADVGLSATYLGWQFTDGIARMMAGQLPASGLGIVRVFTKSNVGDLTLTPDAYASNQWYGPDTFEDNFLTAWGVG